MMKIVRVAKNSSQLRDFQLMAMCSCAMNVTQGARYEVLPFGVTRSEKLEKKTEVLAFSIKAEVTLNPLEEKIQ